MLSSDGRFMATRADPGGRVLVYSAGAPKAPGSGLLGTACVPHSFAFSNDSQFLSILCVDGSVDLFSALSPRLSPAPRLYRSFGSHISKIGGLAASRDGTRIFTGDQWWDTSLLSLGGAVPNVAYTDSVSISADGRYGLTWGFLSQPAEGVKETRRFS